MAALSLIVGLILWLPLAALSGWAFSILWGWFVVPVFDVPALSVGQAIGVGLVIVFMTHQHKYEKDSGGWDAAIYELLMGIFRPLLAVLAGWVYLKVFL